MRSSLFHPRAVLIPLFSAFCVAVAHASAAPRSVVANRQDFDPRVLTVRPDAGNEAMRSAAMRPSPGSRDPGPALALEHPGRFFMRQSYSLTAISGAAGSASSGLYLNTLNYQVTPLMTAFVDVGFHTPIHSSLPGMEQDGGIGSIVLPRMGLEYRPNDRFTLNLELVNGPDAWKAWGGSPYGAAPYRTFPGAGFRN